MLSTAQGFEKDLGSNPSSVESVFFSTERFTNSSNIITTNEISRKLLVISKRKTY